MAAKKNELFDFLILSQNRSQVVADGAVSALIRFFAATQLAAPTGEALATGWTEVYFGSGGACHDLFVEGERPDGYSPFKEMTFRFGSEKATLPFGPVKEAPFFILIQGASIDELGGAVRTKIQEILLIKPDIHSRPFEAIRPHEEVPEGEERKDKKKLTRSSPNQSAGTRVEEY
jgi:hypothetical protein